MEDKFQYSDMLQIKVLNLTQLDEAIKKYGEETPIVKWSKIIKAKTMEELEKLANKDEVLEGINLEHENTLRERERADAAEAENRRLLKLLSEKE